MATTKLIRRRFYAATAAACAIAAVLSVAPLTADRPTTEGAPEAFLNQIEGPGFDHNQAHRPPTATAIAAAKADVRACRTAPAGSPFCPDPPSSAATLAAARETGALQPEESAEPDGLWSPLIQIPTTAIHAIVLPTGKVLFFSQPKYSRRDRSSRRRQRPRLGPGHRHLRTPCRRRSWPTGPDSGATTAPANLWCGGQTQLPDGRVLVAAATSSTPRRARSAPQRVQGREVGHDLRPVDRDLDPLPGHGPRPLVPEPLELPDGGC